MTPRDLDAIEAQVNNPATACDMCDPDTRALLMEVRRLRKMLDALVRHPAVSNDVLVDCDIEYRYNPGVSA
jgi:hypothetical protein